MEPITLVAVIAVVLVTAVMSRRAGVESARRDASAAAGRESRNAVERLGGSTGRVSDARDDLFTLLTILDMGVVRLDRDLRVLSANEVAHRLFDRPLGGMRGRPLLEAVVDVGVEEFLRAESRATSSSEWREFEIARGKFTTVALRSAAGNGWWLLARDDSEIVRLRRIRTEFIENLSHELRTPVTAIGLIAELLAADMKGSSVSSSGAVAPKVRERILQLESESIHLGQMINELLDLARIESGEGMHRNDEIDVAVIVRSAVDRLAPFAAQAKVGVKIESPQSVKLAPRGNLSRLSQVVVNLLHNAIKFSSASSAVEVRVTPPTTNHANARIIVIDHGVGIARADLDRVFERFFIADRARSKGGGTGLGLSIARHIVEAHGGDISAISTLGEGSTFTITLPSR